MFATRWRPQPASGSRALRPRALSGAEWQVVVGGRVNLLVEGPKSSIQQTILNASVDLLRPLAWWCAGQRWPENARTVVIEELARLGAVEQRELLERVVARDRPVQIIATSSTPVYRAVCSGAFPAQLYYLLNTIRIELR